MAKKKTKKVLKQTDAQLAAAGRKVMRQMGIKVGPEKWPTQHMVLWRTTLDDVPLLLTPDRQEAVDFAAGLKLGGDYNDLECKEAQKAHKVMGIDICSSVNIAIVSFRKGVPFRFAIVRNLI